MRLHLAGVLEFHIARLPIVSKPGPRPLVSALARSQARRGQSVTTARLITIELQDDVSRRLVALLDGTREVPALARELAPLLNQPENTAAGSIEANLRNLAEMGLLAG
jgi:hypothetical protein